MKQSRNKAIVIEKKLAVWTWDRPPNPAGQNSGKIGLSESNF